jgi:2-C-methyl-D-erythritol 4-phosphate cytidylyltransferase
MNVPDSTGTDLASKTSLPPRSVAAILPAAGSGSRFGSHRNKLFATLGGQPLWTHAVATLSARLEVGRIVMAVAERDREQFTGEASEWLDRYRVELVDGGAERTDSVRAALRSVVGDPSIGWVAVHDAARPLVRDADLNALFRTAATTGAAILATPVAGTVKRDLGDQQRCETVDRRDLWIAMTPQVFRVDLLNRAYDKHNGRSATDDAQLVERLGHHVALVPGAADNLKITFPEDLLVAEAILASQSHHAPKTTP